MSRYQEDFERNSVSVFAQVTLGIIAASLILGSIAGVVFYLKNEAETTQLRILAQEFGRKQVNIVVPKTRDQIVYEKSTKAYEQAVNETAEFKRFYQRPEKCNFQRDKETRVYCANHFMRAKKEWEASRNTNL
jgi:hypothetical protein